MRGEVVPNACQRAPSLRPSLPRVRHHSSVNEVICHGIPDSRPLVDGDIVNLDISIFTAEGFHADLNETYLVGGAVDEKSKRLVK